MQLHASHCKKTFAKVFKAIVIYVYSEPSLNLQSGAFGNVSKDNCSYFKFSLKNEHLSEGSDFFDIRSSNKTVFVDTDDDEESDKEDNPDDRSVRLHTLKKENIPD